MPKLELAQVGETLGWVAAAVSAGIGLPQVMRTIRLGSVAGLGLFTWQALFVAGVGWAFHGFYQERIQIVLPNALMALSAAVILWHLQRGRQLSYLRTWALPIAIVVVAVAADIGLGPIAYAAVMFIPAALGQVAQYLQIHQSDDVSGVSMPTLVMVLLSQFVWLSYAFLTHEAAIIAVASPMAVLASVVILRLLLKRRMLAGVLA